MSNRKNYMFKNAKKCIEVYGDQRWQFLEVWAAYDEDYHGLPCEKLVNPVAAFTKWAKSGKFDSLSDDQYNRALAKIEEASSFFDNEARVTPDFLMQNIIIHGAFEGKDAEKSLIDYLTLLIDYQDILSENASDDTVEEFECQDAEETEKESQEKQEVYLSAFEKAVHDQNAKHVKEAEKSGS